MKTFKQFREQNDNADPKAVKAQEIDAARKMMAAKTSDARKFYEKKRAAMEKLSEEDPMISYRKNVDAQHLVPTRSGSKGDEE